jgi:hypothetical protein
MSLFVLAPDTVRNPRALKTGSVPRKHLKRIAILPKREFSWALWFRVLVESEVLRFSVALSPFVIAMIIWRDLALPISQGPLIMVVVVGIFELRVLRIPKHRRDRVTSEAEAARALDALAYKGRGLLSEIAARRGVTQGELMLVVEQSELAFFAPLTLVSVQSAHEKPHVVALDAEERALLRGGLFDATLTEAALHKANLRENVFLRSVSFDARGVSGHSRMAALLAKAPA